MKAATVMRVLLLAAALIGGAGSAQAAEINALITTAIETVIDEVVPPFERETGNTVRVSYGPSGGVARRFLGGEPADVVIMDSRGLDDLIKQGRVMAGATNLASTGIGICVKKGAARPDVSTPEALKRALLAAHSIGYTALAGGGITAVHITKMFERLGIAAEVAPKLKFAAGGPNGRVSVLVSSGEAEIGLQQVSELLSNPDVDVIGMLPGDLQQITIYSAGITTSAKAADAARALIKALATPSAKLIFKAKGLDPL
jgi:molybdate transport system substrate-binding protein